MNSRRMIAALFAMTLGVFAAHRGMAQQASQETSPFAAADAQIFQEIELRSEVMKNLEFLSDEIGPRLTRSPQLKRANEWLAEKMKEYGLTNVHQEPWKGADHRVDARLRCTGDDGSPPLSVGTR